MLWKRAAFASWKRRSGVLLACLAGGCVTAGGAGTRQVVAQETAAGAQGAEGNVVPIGRVQGSVGALDAGAGFASPLAGGRGRPGAKVVVQGVVTARTLGENKGQPLHGFFVQNTPAQADGDDSTSDGVWVFHSRYPRLRDGYEPSVGDEIIVRGQVSEYFGQTQLTQPSLVRVVRRGLSLDREVPALDAAPPDDNLEAARYWERHEGMRARVPSGALALSGRHAFGNDSEVWLVRGDHTLATRPEKYARRAFRDAHPLDNAPGRNDGNGYRIALGSQALSAQGNGFGLGAARAFDRLRQDAIGPIAYSFGKYVLQVEAPVAFEPGADPSANGAPQNPDRSREYSVATYNIENLYDFRDDPNDGCDFGGNAGCPGVEPPFDYAPKSQAQYEDHLNRLARQIASDLHAPDVLLIQEAEDQDICRVENGAMACGTSDNADGKPDTLQELALAIQKAGGPGYEAAFDRDGADARGITCAFLFQTDRVALAPVAAGDPLLSGSPRVEGFASGLPFNAQSSNPKSLNAPLAETQDRDREAVGRGIFTRAPLVGRFRVFRERVGEGAATDLFLIANHFSSRPDQRVTQRRAQAKYLAALVSTLQKAQPGARVIAGGDLNVFPRPDDPFAPISGNADGKVPGNASGNAQRQKPSDQLAPLYDANLANLWDVLVREAPASAYTYLFNGQAQTLDHLWNTPVQREALVQVRVAHINSDWPDGGEDLNRRGSDHDPVVACYRF